MTTSHAVTAVATESAMDENTRATPTDGALAAPIRLLAVDDDEAVLRSLRSLFRGQAYRLRLASSGADALRLLEEHEFDVILSDMRMPEMDGLQFLEEARRRFPEPMRIVLSGYADPISVIGVLNAANIYAYVHKPWDNDDLRLKVHRAAEQVRLQRLIERQNAELDRLNRGLEEKVRERTAQLEAARDQLQLTLFDLRESYDSIVKMLAHVAELRMPRLRSHSQQVSTTAAKLARGLALTNDQIRDIETAALLHDIGLIVMPDDLLAIPLEQMNAEQLAQYRRHPELGEATLMGIPAMREVAAMVRSHHESYDGAGYPDGLVGSAIPLGARIIAIASDYHDLMDGLASNTALSADDAFNRMAQDLAHRYAPRLLELFDRLRRQVSGADQPEEDEVLTLGSSGLQPGMVLHAQLLSRDGMLLLSAGHALTRPLIDAIKRMEQGDQSRYLIDVYAKRRFVERPSPSPE